jgi:hypothetical protein
MTPRLAGYRNVLLILSYLGWTLIVLRLSEPPSGFTPDLIYALSTLIAWVGGIVVAALTARAANKIADRWEPGAFRGGLAGKNGGTPSASPPE